MPLLPLGVLDFKTVKICFEIMEDFNQNRDISRIENVEERDLDFFKAHDFRTYEKSKEYIVVQNEMEALKGEKFRHKRNLYNFFIKHHDAVFRDYKANDQAEVLSLYKTWAQERGEKNKDRIYHAMLEDSFKAFTEMLSYSAGLGIQAKVVEIGGKVRAFTSGFAIHRRLFCINFEVADLGYKGLSQFIFCEFSKSLRTYPEINIMDDCGIQNIRRTKLSYRPKRMVSSLTALLGS